jgi:predicted Ser/Thr protein kinase
MTQIETSAFFRTLHSIEAINADSSDLYIEGYEFVMDDVRFAVMSGDVKNMYALDEFVNHMDAYAEDNEPGDYARGYQDAVNVCLAALSQLLEPTAV